MIFFRKFVNLHRVIYKSLMPYFSFLSTKWHFRSELVLHFSTTNFDSKKMGKKYGQTQLIFFFHKLEKTLVLRGKSLNPKFKKNIFSYFLGVNLNKKIFFEELFFENQF